MDPLSIAIVVGLIQGGKMLNAYFEKKDAERKTKNDSSTTQSVLSSSSAPMMRHEEKPDHLVK